MMFGIFKLFDRFKKKKYSPRIDHSVEYRKILFEADSKFPHDPMARIEYFKEHGTLQQYLVYLSFQTQYYTNLVGIGYNKQYNIGYLELENLFRAIVDAVGHLDPEIHEGVFRYINSKLEDTTLRICRSAIDKQEQLHN